MNHKLSTENILSEVDAQRLFNHYLQPFHNKGHLKEGANISNPFQSEKQKTPSFNYYQSPNGQWLYKDFATGDSGDIFSLVMKLNNCDFKQCLEIINSDFNLGLENSLKSFIINKKTSFNESETSYWANYGINEDILSKYGIKTLDSYTTTNHEGKEFTVKSTLENPIFAYEVEKDRCYKIYRPLSPTPNYKFTWLGEKPIDFIFGYDQLPEKDNTVYIVGGEKDVLTMSSLGFNAITMNSETALPTKELIDDLKGRFKEIIILYDIDETGIKKSKEICQLYGLSRITLPKELAQSGGKDISDYVQQGLDMDLLNDYKENFQKQIDPKSNLHKILKSQQILKENKSKSITFSDPIIMRHDIPFFHPNTINVIQGKSGTHKSRLAQTICSSLIKKSNHNNELLGLKKDESKDVTVCYVDTERNLSDQLPFALQQIQIVAGYRIEENPENFIYISLIEVKREDRFEALRDFLTHISQNIKTHIFIVLDVITDCLRDFNRAEDSMKLVDLMNETINQFDVTFLCLIHENPGSTDKARGHLGTEIMNKSSTVIQINFELGKNNEPSDIIKIKFLKCRNTKKPDPFYLEFDEEQKELIEIDWEKVNELIQSRVKVATFDQISECLKLRLKEPVNASSLVKLLVKDLACGEKTIRMRLKELHNSIIKNYANADCYLRNKKKGNQVIYFLEPIGVLNDDIEF